MDSVADMPLRTLPVAYQAPDERRFWTKLRRVLAQIPFAEDLVAGYYCALDRDTPTRVRAILFGAIAYFVLPADAVPDLFVGLGFTDDAAVLAAAIAAVSRHLQPRHRARPAPAWSASPTSLPGSPQASRLSAARGACGRAPRRHSATARPGAR